MAFVGADWSRNRKTAGTVQFAHCRRTLFALGQRKRSSCAAARSSPVSSAYCEVAAPDFSSSSSSGNGGGGGGGIVEVNKLLPCSVRYEEILAMLSSLSPQIFVSRASTFHHTSGYFSLLLCTSVQLYAEENMWNLLASSLCCTTIFLGCQKNTHFQSVNNFSNAVQRSRLCNASDAYDLLDSLFWARLD